MKLLSVEIKAFGKLKNTVVRFNDGLNVFQQANGVGKTTLSNFIRAMLYGFTYSRTKGLTDASHWQPWNSAELFGGSMLVENSGEIYRIERFFGTVARQEKCIVTDERTGKNVSWQRQPGEVLLGLTAESYDRSAYFPQEAVELGSNDNLEARLANLVQNSAEDFEKIQEHLRVYKKNLRYEKGVGGIIPRLEEEKRRLQQQLYNAEQAKRRQAEIDVQLKQIADERAEITRRQAELKTRSEQLRSRIAQYSRTEETHTREQLDEIEKRLRSVPPEIQADVSRCDDIARQIASLPTAAPQPVKKRKWVFGVFAILAVLVVAFAVLGITSVVPLALGVAVGSVCLALGVVCLFFVSPPKSREKVVPDSTRPNLEAQFFDIARKYVFAEVNDVESARRALWEIYSRYQADLRTKEALLPLVNRPTADTSSIQKQLTELEGAASGNEERQKVLLADEVRLNEERKRLVTNSVETEDQILSVENGIKEAEYRYSIADMVSNLLLRAKDNLSGSYLPGLCARTTQLLRETTASNLEAVVDRSFSVSLRENGQTKPMSEFSRGIREITLLCFGIALSELLYNGKVPLLIVDDAFVNFDENNFVRATELLNKISRHAQVIYFTCHSRTGNLLK